MFKVAVLRGSAPLVRALNLKNTGIFKLLVLITALLSWVVAVGAAGTSLLQNLHTRWQLNHSETLTVYLPPETDAAAVQGFLQTLPALVGAGPARVEPPEALRRTLQQVVSTSSNLPLPTVLTLSFSTPEAATMLTDHVLQTFPSAEVDNHQTLLATMARTVRFLQLLAAGLGGTMLALMGLLIVLTTRTGLMAESATLQLLVQLGAPDALLLSTLARQVLIRTLGGMVLGTAAAAACLLAVQGSPAMAASTGLNTLLILMGAPLLLPVMATVAAVLTARSILKTRTL